MRLLSHGALPILLSLVSTSVTLEDSHHEHSLRTVQFVTVLNVPRSQVCTECDLRFKQYLLIHGKVLKFPVSWYHSKTRERVLRVMNSSASLICKAANSEHVTCESALVASTTQARIQDFYNLLHCDHVHCFSLPFWPPWNVPPHTLSALLPTIAFLVFRTGARNLKASTTFFHLSLCLGQYPFICVTWSDFCLPSSHNSRLIFSQSLTPNTSTCL